MPILTASELCTFLFGKLVQSTLALYLSEVWKARRQALRLCAKSCAARGQLHRLQVAGQSRDPRPGTLRLQCSRGSLGNMLLSDTTIESFRQAYRVDFGEDIAIAEARVMAQNLMTLLEQLAKPLPGESASSPPSSSPTS